MRRHLCYPRGGITDESLLRCSSRHKLRLLYALNVADWICTSILLRSGGFYEANPLMAPVMAHPALGLTVKAVLPAFLLLLVGKLTGMLGHKELIRLDRFIAFALALYTALCAAHIVNFLLLNVTKTVFLS